MHPITESEDSLCPTPDSSFPSTPEELWLPDPDTYVPRGPTEALSFETESEPEAENMEIMTSNGLPPLPEGFLEPHDILLPPIITHMAVDSSTTAPSIHRASLNGEGPSSPAPPSSSDVPNEALTPLFYYLGEQHWKRLEQAIWAMRAEEGMQDSELFGKTVGNPPVPAFTGEPLEDTVPLLAARAIRTEGRLYELEKYDLKALVEEHVGMEIQLEEHNTIIEQLSDQMKELQTENSKLKRELESKGRKLEALEIGLAMNDKRLDFYKELTHDMGAKIIEWDKKMNTTFEAIAKAASMGIDPSTSSSSP